MSRHLSLVFVSLFGIALWCGQSSHGEPTPTTSSSAEKFFTEKVHPLIQSKCYGCHGEDKKNVEGELDMSSRENLLKGGESGKPALVPGKPDESPMYGAVLRAEKLKMPPKDRNALSREEAEILREWIASGAVWVAPPTNTTAQPKWSYKEEDIWAFRPVKSVKAPETSASCKSPVDAFVQRELRKVGLKAAPPADKLTLIRRATFDLTGLPPAPAEIDAFLKDKSPDAFDKVVERLLASPRYGEKMARNWLDVVRYADTDGFSNDYERPNAWRYRDYVIRSFNADKAYNRFVLEQIAGDEFDASDPENVIAVGMLRMGPWEHTAMSVAAVTRQLFLDDVTSITGSAFLGLTTGCARCHDHKFDPIPTRDYYRLQSCFATTQFEARDVAFLPIENTQRCASEMERVRAAMKGLRSRIKEIQAKHDDAVNAWMKQKGYAALKDVPLQERPKKDFGLTAADMGTEKVLRKRLEYLEREMKRFEPQAFSVASDIKSDAPALRVLIGGALESPGDAVTPGVLSAVYNSDDSKSPSDWNTVPSAGSGRRLQLAKWIASPQNPLTARVMVNRIWQWHFGKGLVKSSNNFGKMGDRPTNPELLDWLATYFVEHGWSMKEMHRLIMHSQTYQQSSAPADTDALKKLDPEEKLLAHFLPRRMTAEELRDSILAVSGQLNNEMGGPPVFPEINLEAALQPRHIMGSMAPPYVPSPTREQRNRRTIYAVQIRSLPDPLLQVFNVAPTEISCERRDQTTVTPQVFALFNSQMANDAALTMAANLSKETKSPAKQIQNAFILAYGRQPTANEQKLCMSHFRATQVTQRGTQPVDFRFPAKVERSMVEELTGEPFDFEEAWDTTNYEYNLQPSEVSPETRALASVCLVMLNSNEFVYIY